MRIMFIDPKMPVFMRMPSVPLGLVSIASFLKANGHEVTIIERSVKKIDIEEELKAFKPDIVGITALSYSTSPDAKYLTKYIHRHHPGIPVIWGGAGASSLPELYLRDGGMDFLILGEGELTWKEFVDEWGGGRNFDKIKGLAYLKDGEYVCNPIRPVTDLTTLPELDWSLVTPQKYFISFFHCSKMLYLHASKGCPASCTFCANKQFHQGKNRCRKPEHVMHDIEYLVGTCGADGIYFSDEQFLPNRTIRNTFLQMIIDSGLNFVWGCQMRIGVLKEEDIDFMYQAGCRWILFGLETGDPDIMKIIKKGINLDLAKPTIDYCRKLGITVQASFIIGFPDETEEQIKSTIRLAKSLPSAMPVLNILTLLPNSEMYYEHIKDIPDYKPPKKISQLIKFEKTIADNPSINLSNVPYRELKVIHHFFQWKDFSGRDSVADDSFGIIKKLASDTMDRIFKHGIRGFFYGGFNSVKQFVTVYYYSHCFPSIVKKYDLK